MTSPCKIVRWLVVSALAASLSVAPLCTPSIAMGCPVASAKHAGAECCCGEHCHCLNCCSHEQPSNDRQNSPKPPNDPRELAKIGPVVASLSCSLADAGRIYAASSPAAEFRPLQTLVAQHACLRV